MAPWVGNRGLRFELPSLRILIHGRYDEHRLRLNVGSEGEGPISGLQFNRTGKNLGVHAAAARICDDSEGDHRVYLPSSPLISAQRAWSNICATRRVQRMCCFFSIRQSTSWSTVDSTHAVDTRWPSWYSLP